MQGRQHQSQRSARRAARWLRGHWRMVSAGLLASGGAPIGVIAGLSSTHHRVLWLIGAGACAGLAVLISLLPARPPPDQPPNSRVLEPGSATPITRVSIVHPAPMSPLQPTRRWTIPAPVRSFTGRADLLHALREQLTREGAAALIPTTAVYGIGGVGKTQLALAYAHRYRNDYDLGWWIPADTALSITTGLADLAIALGMPARMLPRELASRAREILAAQAKWLLVFDNAGDPTDVASFLPATGNGHVLITSRSPAWQGIADRLQSMSFPSTTPLNCSARVAETTIGAPVKP
jgi:hypothetical protein